MEWTLCRHTPQRNVSIGANASKALLPDRVHLWKCMHFKSDPPHPTPAMRSCESLKCRRMHAAVRQPEARQVLDEHACVLSRACSPTNQTRAATASFSVADALFNSFASLCLTLLCRAEMISGVFIYNHKGDCMVSRLYRDDVRCDTCHTVLW